MGKVNYLIKRIAGMNYKTYFEKLKDIHKKTGKNRIYLFWDSVRCGIKYQAGYMDYWLFEMYDLNKEQRKTIITRGKNNEIIKKYNNPEYYHFIRNKVEFNKKFHKFIKRDWMNLTNENFEEFQMFTEKHPIIIVKPVAESCGKGIEKIKITKKNIHEVYTNLLNEKRTLVEEVAEQCPEIAKLHPYSINTIRVVTIKGCVVAAFLRIGNHKNIVDNFNHGGMVAPINISTGIIDYLAIDKERNLYEKHPITKEDILWFQIPKWPRIKALCEKASTFIPEIGYVGWDVCMGKKDPFLIEANEMPGHDVYQLPPHRTNGMGLLPSFEKAMKKVEEENETIHSS